MAPVWWKTNDFLAGEQRFELMKSRRSRRPFRTWMHTFDLTVKGFYQFYFYCLAYEITITWPKCILVCSINVTWCKINVKCGYSSSKNRSDMALHVLLAVVEYLLILFITQAFALDQITKNYAQLFLLHTPSSLRKTVGKTVTDSGYAYVIQWF